MSKDKCDLDLVNELIQVAMTVKDNLHNCNAEEIAVIVKAYAAIRFSENIAEAIEYLYRKNSWD